MLTNPTPTDPLLTERQAAEILDLRPTTLQVWRMTKKRDTPAYVKIGRNVRYRASAVEAFIRSRTVTA